MGDTHDRVMSFLMCGGAAWKNTWCSLIWPKELIFPFSVGSEDTPGMTEKSSCYIAWRNMWVLLRWQEIQEFAVMVSPSQMLASPQITSLCISDCFSQCVSRLVLNTISVEKPAFCLFGVNHAHFETLTNQTTVVRCGIRKNLLRWCDHNRWIGWVRASKLFFNAIYYQNGELVDSVRILIVRCNTDTMLKKKHGRMQIWSPFVV